MGTSLTLGKYGLLRDLSGREGGAATVPASPIASPESFYITANKTADDVEAVAKLAQRPNYYFAPLAEASRKWHPNSAAAMLVHGFNTDFTMAVRSTQNDKFLGLVLFTKIEKNRGGNVISAELSYLMNPDHHGEGLGRSVLRAVDYFIRLNKMEERQIAQLWATFDPGTLYVTANGPKINTGNDKSHRILKRIGLQLKDYIETSEYTGQDGLPRARNRMVGTIKHDIGPALAAAKKDGYYSPQNPAGKFSLETPVASSRVLASIDHPESVAAIVNIDQGALRPANEAVRYGRGPADQVPIAALGGGN